MRRNRGFLLCAVALAFALPGTGSALAAEFKSSESPVDLFGEQEAGAPFTLNVDGQYVSCTTATMEAKGVAMPTTTLSLAPAYSGCTAFGFAGATISTEGCQLELLQPNALLQGNMAIACPPMKSIVVQVSAFGTSCKVTLGTLGNAKLSRVDYTNLHSNTKVGVDFRVTGVTASKMIDNGLCPLNGTGTVTNGTYSGNFVVNSTSGATVDVT